jgi:hypothetical protein
MFKINELILYFIKITYFKNKHFKLIINKNNNVLIVFH